MWDGVQVGCRFTGPAAVLRVLPLGNRSTSTNSAGIRAVTAALRCQSCVRRLTSPVVRQSGQCAHRNQ